MADDGYGAINCAFNKKGAVAAGAHIGHNSTIISEPDLIIMGDSNKSTESWCLENQQCYKLPPAEGEGCEKDSSSINGGKKYFTSREFEIYKVFVRKLNYLKIVGSLR